MWQVAAVELTILALEFVYHRLFDSPPTPPLPPGTNIQIPRTDPGSPISLIYGRTRVRSPILVFCGDPQAYTGTSPQVNDASLDNTFIYAMNMSFVLGIPFTNGGQSFLWNMWVGDALALIDVPLGPPGLPSPYYPIPGTGPHKSLNIGFGSGTGYSGAMAGPQIEFLDGNPNQGDTAGPGGFTQEVMASVDDQLPGYRGVLLVSCFDIPPNAWLVGGSPTVPSYSFEVSTYPTASLGPNNGQILDTTSVEDAYGNRAYDANPIDVLYDILTGKFGKLALDPSKIDLQAFIYAANTLYGEGHGYSIAAADGATAKDIIQDILKQIDATFYTNPSTGLATIKLIRPDYDPNKLLVISPDTGAELQNFSMGGWVDVPNKVRINFPNRFLGYQMDSAVAINNSSVIANGHAEIIIQMMGVSNGALAAQIAAREIAAQSRPIAKCTAIVDPSFYPVNPGDPIVVTWPEANISGMVFRVGNVNRGVLKDGKIQLDLVQDYFYQWRNQRPQYPIIGKFPVPTRAI